MTTDRRPALGTIADGRLGPATSSFVAWGGYANVNLKLQTHDQYFNLQFVVKRGRGARG